MPPPNQHCSTVSKDEFNSKNIKSVTFVELRWSDGAVS